MGEMLNLILKTAGDSFLQVTVFVGAALLLFGLIDYKMQGGLIRSIERSKRYQPLIGGFLGVTPGCGGAIFIMPLYIKGSVSFGTVVATLIATAGDSAFVLLTRNPRIYLTISICSYAVAIITGYIVDYFKIGYRDRNLVLSKSKKEMEIEHTNYEAQDATSPYNLKSHDLRHIGHEEGDEVDVILHHRNKVDQTNLSSYFFHRFYGLFWALTAVGLFFGISLLFQITYETAAVLNNMGTHIGIAGTFVCLLLMFLSKKFLKDDSHEEQEHKLYSLRETVIHTGSDTVFVGTWVFFAYLIYEIAVLVIGGENVLTSWMLSAGLTSVILGALIGLIPGCGPQVLFVALYTKGCLPFAALLSNAISQDGDALFPLLAMDKKSAVKATVITTVPALIIGLLSYYIEVKQVPGWLG